MPNKIPRIKFDTQGIPDLSKENLTAQSIYSKLETSPDVSLTPEEIAGLGLNVGADWKVKALYNADKTGLTFNFTTPDNWQINGEDQYISPEGKTLTRSEYEDYFNTLNQQAETQNIIAGARTLSPYEYPNWQMNDPMVQAFKQNYLSELDLNAPEKNTVERAQWIQQHFALGDYTKELVDEWNSMDPTTLTAPASLEEQTTYEFTPEILDTAAKVLPWAKNFNIPIDQFLSTMLKQGTEQFLSALEDVGRTPDSEKLLQLLYPDITPEDIDAVYYNPFKNIPAEGREIPIESINGGTRYAFIMPDFRLLSYDDKELLGYYDPATKTITPYEPEDLEKAQSQLSSVWKNAGGSGWTGLKNLVLSSVGVGGAWLEKYAGRPWETAMMETVLRVGAMRGDKGSQDIIDRLDKSFEKHGWRAIFSQDTGNAWNHLWDDAAQQDLGWGRWVAEAGNPIFMVPVGGAFGTAAKWTSKIPILSDALRISAAIVNVGEKILAMPIEGGLKFSGWVLKNTAGELISKSTGAWAKKILAKTNYIINPLELPETRALIADDISLNWQKRFLQVITKAPLVGEFAKSGIEKSLGWKILIRKESQDIEDIVARSAVAYKKFVGMGENAKAVETYGLREFLDNPVKYFGLERGYSQTMADRLLPAFKGEANAGTLEHIITHSEMYSWAGMEKGLQYVTRFREIQNTITAMLEREKILPENMVDDWIHRQIQQYKPTKKLSGVGRTAKSFGAKQPFEKMRKFKTMAEGIQWFASNPELGMGYANNPELYVGSFIQQSFEKVGQERAIRYLAEEFEKVGRAVTSTYDAAGNLIAKTPGMAPSQMLTRYAELFEKLGPGQEIAEKAVLRAAEKESADNFVNLVNRAIRGERIPEQTIKAVERRFPELGQKFRALASGNRTVHEDLLKTLKDTESNIASLISHNRKITTELTALKEQGKITAVKLKGYELKNQEQILKIRQEEMAKIQQDYFNTIPNEVKLREAFKVMNVDDRNAFRATMSRQTDDIGSMVYEQTSEMGMVDEFLKTDRVASYRVNVGTVRQGAMDVVEVEGKKIRVPTEKTKVVTKYQRLDEILVSAKEGTTLDTFTVAQARKINPNTAYSEYLIKGNQNFNKVPRGEVLQKTAQGFGFAGVESFVDHLNKIIDMRSQLNDLKLLNRMGTERLDQIKMMTKLLDDVDSPRDLHIVEPEVPKAAPGEPSTLEARLKDFYGIAKDDDIVMSILPDGTKIKGKGTGAFQHRGVATSEQILENRIIRVAPESGEFGVNYSFEVRTSATKQQIKSIKEILENLDKDSFNYLDLTNEFGKDIASIKGNPREILDKIDDVLQPTIPKAEVGMPEAGMATDFFGYQKPVYPVGKGEVTQINMDDLAKLQKARADAGITGPPEVIVKPQIEGIPELAGPAEVKQFIPQTPKVKSAAEIRKEFEALRDEVKALSESRKYAWKEAKAERAVRMEQVKQSTLEEGYIMAPSFTGKMQDRDFIDAWNKFYGFDKGGNAVLKVAGDAAGILRVTKAALDFSAMAIQGLPAWGLAHTYLFQNPKIGMKLMGSWYQSFFYHVGSFFDPTVIAKYVSKNHDLIMERVMSGGSAKAVDYFSALESKTGIGGKAEWLLDRIPLKPFQRAEVSFFSAGEIVRDEFWRIMSPRLTAAQKFEYARFLDRITGITDASALGVPLSVRQLEQTIGWFAPNYTRSCLTVLADIFRGGLTGAETRKAIGGMIAAGAAMYTGVQFAMSVLGGATPEQAWDSVKTGFGINEDPITGQVNWKPGANFMTIKVGNYNMGFGGFWYGLLRLGGNIADVVNETGDKERIDLVKILKNGGLNKDNPFVYWWFSRSSPFFSTAYEMASGKDFLGYPIETPMEYAKYMLTRFEPIWIEQGLNWLVPGMARDQEIPEGFARVAVGPAEIFGMRTFPDSSWVDFYDKVKNIIKELPEELLRQYFDDSEIGGILKAQQEGTLGWKQLPEPLQIKLRGMDSSLEKLYQTAIIETNVRDTAQWQQWQGVQETNKKEYYGRGDELIGLLKSGEIDTKTLREKWSEAGQNYGTVLGGMENIPAFDSIYDYFNSKESTGDKYNWNVNLALGEYLQIIATDFLDSKGDFDFKARDEVMDAFISKWGDDNYQLIRQMYNDKKNLAGLDPVLIQLADDKDVIGRKGYWDLPYKPVYQMTEEDMASGSIPEKYISLWQTYKNLKTEDERDEFLQANPDLAKNWRSTFRAENPEVDALLAVWGYGGKIQTMEAYNLVVEEANKLGISIEQLALGLPPQSLAPKYFEFTALQSGFGSSSAEAKLYRLENPDFQAWGEDDLGWKPVETDIDVLRLNVKWKTNDLEYKALKTADEKSSYLTSNSEYFRARLTRDAYKKGFPDEMLTNYIEYNMLPEAGYARERYLQNNPAFYDSAFEINEWKERVDFTKIPSEKVESLYTQYLELKAGKERTNFRRDNPELDTWLVYAKGLKPLKDITE